MFGWSQAFLVLFAVSVLNFSLSFHNVWPTPWIRLRPELSVEISAIVLLLAVRRTWFGATHVRVQQIMAAAIVILALGRYADVIAPALYGRPINLYWDAKHFPRVALMILDSSELWLIVTIVLGIIVGITALFFGIWWAIAVIVKATEKPLLRTSLIGLAASALTLYAVGMTSRTITTERWFSVPVSLTYVRQLNFIYDAIMGHSASDQFAAQPNLSSDLSRLQGKDAYLIFLESYGAVVFDTLDHDKALAPSIDALAKNVDKNGWHAVTALYESPTFGGASWLSHATLMTGAWITAQHEYQLLLTTDRQTLAQYFQNAGYRAVALMPGLKMAWPEGAFYNYSKIWDAASLKYRGPAFGWWEIPDQYSFAQFYRAEASKRNRQPLFTFFATISSHMPFAPTPPYQSDWWRLLSSTPYEEETLSNALHSSFDWSNLQSAYTTAIKYDLQLLGGLLRITADQNPIVIAVGDHQPPSLVAGADARWVTPVHIFARDEAFLDPFTIAGFQRGLRPTEPALGRLDELHTLLLQSFDSSWRVIRR